MVVTPAGTAGPTQNRMEVVPSRPIGAKSLTGS